MVRNAQLNALGSFELTVEDELGLVVQFINDDVVALPKVQRVGDDILSFAGREQEADLVR